MIAALFDSFPGSLHNGMCILISVYCEVVSEKDKGGGRGGRREERGGGERSLKLIVYA